MNYVCFIGSRLGLNEELCGFCRLVLPAYTGYLTYLTMQSSLD
jgi:hypothetical protein